MARLTAAKVRNAKAGPGGKLRCMGDGPGGRGLTLRVRACKDGSISRTFVQRVRIGNRATNLALGRYPELGLAEARRLAAKNVADVRRGSDPRVRTVGQAGQLVFERDGGGWAESTKRQWRRTLGVHLAPVADTPLGEVTPAHVLAVVEPMWSVTPPLAKQTLYRLRRILDWAVTHGHLAQNPATAVAAGLGKRRHKTRHHTSVHHQEAAKVLAAIRAADAHPGTKLCLEFTALTACRGSEARGATWQEIDLAGKLWTIPAGRMKTREALRIPLTGTRTRAVLVEAGRLYGKEPGALVFPNRLGSELGRASVCHLMRRCAPATVHGWRSTVRTWCQSRDVSWHVAEAILGHTLPPVSCAYARGDLLPQRAKVLRAWDSFATGKPLRSRMMRVTSSGLSPVHDDATATEIQRP